MLGEDNRRLQLTLIGILTPACIILGWSCWIMPGCLIMFMPSPCWINFLFFGLAE